MTDEHDPCRIADQAEIDAIRDEYPGLYEVVEGGPIGEVVTVRMAAALELVELLRRLRAAEAVCEALRKPSRSMPEWRKANAAVKRALAEWKAVRDG